MTLLRNWAGNIEYGTTAVHYPETLEELQELVRRLDKVRVLGTGHTFNPIADSQHNLILLDRLPRVIDIHPDTKTVTLSANVTYGELCPVLQQAGFALSNLASLMHLSVVGACATGTHGSGVNNQNLSSAISAMTLVRADGELIHLSWDADAEDFNGTVVHLGALGAVTELTLDFVPTFEMRQQVLLNLPVSQLAQHFDDIMASAYSVSLFTDWREDFIQQVWLKLANDADSPIDDFYGAIPAKARKHPIMGMSAVNATEQLGIVGLWYDRLPHFRLGITPSVGNELQSEYFVPKQYAVNTIQSLQQLHSQMKPYLLVSEIRCVAQDDLWLSPCYGRDSVAFHFTWRPDWDAVQQLLPKIEEELAPFAPRPHWGKLFTLSSEKLKAVYPQFNAFEMLMNRYDSNGKFRNTFLETYFPDHRSR